MNIVKAVLLQCIMHNPFDLFQSLNHILSYIAHIYMFICLYTHDYMDK